MIPPDIDSAAEWPPFYKATFGKIDEERRRLLLEMAVAEFAQKGFNAANINEIARRSGISIGSMYSYFESKEALFLTIIDEGYRVLKEALTEAETAAKAADEDIIGLFARLLTSSRDYARKFPELTQIYLDATTQGLAPLSGRLSYRLETITASLYQRSIAASKAAGTLRKELDAGALAFYLDNLLIVFQFSFASDYYRDRMRIFAGDSVDADDGEGLIASLVDLVRRSVAPG
ncbi:MAG: TetR/AcrR family transcriptional regulator [Rectinemataceae bacterium]